MLSPPGQKPAAPLKDPNAPKEPRKRRKSAVYDAEGNEVLITMMCLKCRAMKPLTMFGLRKMADGAIRNQPWCRTCRSGAGAKKNDKPGDAVVAATPAVQQAEAHVEEHHDAVSVEAAHDDAADTGDDADAPVDAPAPV